MMRTLYYITFIFLSYQFAFSQNRKEIGNLVLEDIPEIPENLQKQYQHYQNVRSAQFVDWLPGGEGILMATRFGNTSQLHTVQSPGAYRKQITFFEEPLENASFSPSTKYKGFLFTKDSGGNEFSQIFWYNRDIRRSEMISDGKSRNFGISWSNKGDRFAFTSTRRNGKDMDVYVSDMATPKKAELKIDKGNGHYWVAVDWSPDDTEILIIEYISNLESNAYRMDVATGKLTRINKKSKEKALFSPLAWDTSGNYIYALSNRDSEFLQLVKYDIEKNKSVLLSKGIKWDVDEFTISPDRGQGAFVTNENGVGRLYTIDLKTDVFKKVSNIPNGLISDIAFNPPGTELGYSLVTANTTGDIFSYKLDNQEHVRWTFSETGEIDTRDITEPNLITYETFDTVGKKKREISAFVYKAKSTEKKSPVVISIHGGPESQHRPGFGSFYTYLTQELGITIIAPNVRGSTGYGKSFIDLDDGFKREDSVKDIGALIDWIGEQPEYDSDRIAVFGGSYGGYMVLGTMMHYNDKLRCGVDLFGISNFVSFLEGTEAYRRDLRRAEYGDERDAKMRAHLLKISPNQYPEKFTKPLMVYQGANDPRVPEKESRQMVDAIRKQGGEVWYILAKDEGHGISKKANREVVVPTMVLFFQKHLLD